MWTTKIVEMKRQQGALKVLLAFSNGTDDFTEYVTVSAPETLDVLITNRIQNLNGLDTLASNLKFGVYIPPLVNPPVQPSMTPIQALATLKNLVDLGVKATTDTDYQIALQAAKDSLTGK